LSDSDGVVRSGPRSSPLLSQVQTVAPCAHGIANGDQPDQFFGGLNCPECAKEATT